MATTTTGACVDCDGRGTIARHLLDAHHSEGGGECVHCRGTGAEPTCIECDRPLAKEDGAGAFGLCVRCAFPKHARLAVCGLVIVVSLDAA